MKAEVRAGGIYLIRSQDQSCSGETEGELAFGVHEEGTQCISVNGPGDFLSWSP